MLIVVFVIYTMIVVPIDIAFTTKSYSGSYTTDRGEVSVVSLHMHLCFC